MKLRDQIRDVEVYGVQSASQFTVNPSAKMFKILSDGLYSDKISSIIRELSCNARDAQQDAGKGDEPFEVKLPSMLDTEFFVKDYGTGLSEQQVYDIYTTYFESTKTESNDFIGALGLGSKSPFSYSSSFNVKSRYNGVEYIYSMYMNSEGIPTCSKIAEHETDDSNGLTVSFDVKVEDITAFADKLETQLRHFEVKPKVLGVQNWVWDTVEHEYCNSGDKKVWGIRKVHTYYSSTQSTSYAIQGGVAYPISAACFNDLEKKDRTKADYLRSIIDRGVDLYFDLGELDVTASRESLSYDATTANNIINALERMIKELRESIESTVSKLNTMWELKSYIKTHVTANHGNSNSYNRVVRDYVPKIEWKGETYLLKDLNDYTKVHTDVLGNARKYVDVHSYDFRKDRSKIPHKCFKRIIYRFDPTEDHKTVMSINVPTEGMPKTLVFEFDEGEYKQTVERKLKYNMYEHTKDMFGNTNYSYSSYQVFVVVGPKHLRKKIIAAMGNPKISSAAALKTGTFKAKQTVYGNIFHLPNYAHRRSFNCERMNLRDDWKTVEDNEKAAKKGGIYVPIFSKQFASKSDDGEWHNRNHTSMCRELELMYDTIVPDVFERLRGIPVSNATKNKNEMVAVCEKGKKWQTPKQYATKQLKLFIKDNPDLMAFMANEGMFDKWCSKISDYNPNYSTWLSTVQHIIANEHLSKSARKQASDLIDKLVAFSDKLDQQRNKFVKVFPRISEQSRYSHMTNERQVSNQIQTIYKIANLLLEEGEFNKILESHRNDDGCEKAVNDFCKQYLELFSCFNWRSGQDVRVKKLYAQVCDNPELIEDVI